MNKWILFFVFTSVSTLMTYAFADTFFGAGGTQTAKPASSTKGNQVMSADDFKSAVSTLKQQADSDLSNRWKQELAKVPPPSSQQQNTENNQMNASTSPENGTMSATRPVTTASTPKPGNFPGATQPANTTVAPAQTYTGFGSGQPAAPASTTNSNSKGWNVNY